MSKRQVLIFNRFERFWHWTQAAAIFVLLFTGFGIHGLHPWGDFGTLVSIHVVAALYLMVLWIFAVFWHLTTGSWRHYVPTANGLW
ncbi:MAG: cytochrome b/b6 domain-containing protein, partial [Gammaproteobacteria bacterium]|nr:cytochrome b/b6 domain-containing protein [Gammaproteobacteria bacterium]